MTELAEWDSFYVITGSAAGALIGLQFVVMTLIAHRPRRAQMAGTAFTTPTIVHFGAALLLSALLRAPWRTIAPAAALWGAVGLAGAAYVMIVARRIGMQDYYRPQLEDWLFHVLLPWTAYAALALSALAIPIGHARGAVRGRWRGIAIALRGHSQCLGHHRLSCLFKQPRRRLTGTEAASQRKAGLDIALIAGSGSVPPLRP